MKTDQVQKLWVWSPSRYFLFSWTLTQTTAQAGSCGLSDSIKDLARAVNPHLPYELYLHSFPGGSQTYVPNIIYTDLVTDNNSAMLALATNSRYVWRSHTLTYIAGPHGSIRGTSPQRFVGQGTNGTEVEASPDTGYCFDGWSDGVTTPARTEVNVSWSGTATASFSFCSDRDDDGASDIIEVNFNTDPDDPASTLKANGSSNITGTAVQLTADDYGLGGSVFVAEEKTLAADSGFMIHYSFRINGGPGADGMALILHNDSGGLDALGDAGAGLGYGGIANSIAIALKTYNANSVQLLQNGSMIALTEAEAPFDLQNGKTGYVWVDYGGKRDDLRIYISQTDSKPANPLLSYVIDLHTVIGTSAYLGFSAATGGLSNEHLVYSFDDGWNIDSDQDGLCDADETSYGSDPNNPDSDGDGLSDGDEVNIYLTDPTVADSDADGASDGIEVKFDTDPGDPLSTLKANGNCNLSGFPVQITENDVNQVGSVFVSEKKMLTAETNFMNHYRFQINGGAGANGMALVLHNDSRGLDALGDVGAGLGYQGITDSIAIAFETYYGNSVQLLQNGSMTALDEADAPFDLQDGGVGFAWVDYNGSSDELQVYLSQTDTKPATPLLSYTIDLHTIIGTQAYLGFSGATGASTNEHLVYLFVDGWDSDSDGLSDKDEAAIYGTDPDNPDSDGDGLSDGDEVNVYGTDPGTPYSDGDGLSDGDEVNIYLTDPANPDSDGDGLSDGDEVNIYLTDPTVTDSDADGASDGIEVNFNTDPGDPLSTLKANGDCNLNGFPVQLTEDAVNQAGSVFVNKNKMVTADTGFKIHYRFQINGGAGANGMALVLHNDSRGLDALGDVGEWLGYQGITDSIAIAFETYYGNSVQLLQNGSMTALAVTEAPFDLQNGEMGFSWVDYNGSSDELQVYLSQTDTKPATPLLSYTIDLHTIIGTRAYLGFSGATGASTNEHLVYSFDDGWDSDSDGLSDKDEIETYLTDPDNPDSDGDGLSDGDEVNVYGTDPGSPYSDGDGLSDGDEVTLYGSDPANPDSDGDGLNDGDEVIIYHTDLIDPDSDDDGVSDGIEVNFNTDPGDPASTLSANGNSNLDGFPAQLTAAVPGQSGSVFVSQKKMVTADTGFMIHYSFQINGEFYYDPADGMALVLQNDSSGLNALGTAGSGIGYEGITNSIAIAFKTYNANSVQLLLNGNMVPLAETDVPFALHTAEAGYVWVDYSGSSDELQVYVAQIDTKPETPLFKYTIELNTVVGTQAYLGFSAATGAFFSEHLVNRFNDGWDSDSDGLSDVDETEIHHTDPYNPDSDGDGLNDGDEYQVGTDPNNPDSDNDGFTDFEEITAGTDPLDATSFPVSFPWPMFLPAITGRQCLVESGDLINSIWFNDMAET